MKSDTIIEQQSITNFAKFSTIPKALCLDSDPLSLRLIEKLIGTQFNILSCVSIRHALALIKDQRFDLFICDYSVSAKIDGLAILLGLKRMTGFSAKTCILLSAVVAEGLENQARLSGYDGVFSKPLGREFQQYCIEVSVAV